MFSSLDHASHSARKRHLSNVYAKSTLQTSPALAGITKYILHDGLLPRIANSKNGVTEAYELFNAVALDNVTAYIYGYKNGSKFLQDPVYSMEWLLRFKSRQPFAFWFQEMPGLRAIFDKLGLKNLLVPRWVDEANTDMGDWCLSMGDAAEATIKTGNITDPADEPVVYRQLRNALIKKSTTKQDDSITPEQRVEIASEMLDNLLAGFDTSGITLTYLAWELSKPQHSGIQEKLREELLYLSPNFQSKTEVPFSKNTDTLPWLHAIIMETLRLHAAIPGNQPRTTPANATLGPPGCEIHNLPAGIRVQSQAYSLHRNPSVFPDSETWQPERWIDLKTGQIDSGGEKARWFWAFSSGGRMCVGSNLAMSQMKDVVAAVWSNYRTTIVDDKGMVHNGGYMAGPLGTKEGTFLKLRFLPL